MSVYLLPILAGLLMVLALLSPAQALSYASEGAALFATIMLPAQLPLFICATLLTDSHLLEKLTRPLEKFSVRFLRLPAVTLPAALMGLLSGYPSGARIIGEALPEDLPEQTRLNASLLCSAAGPGYLIGSVGTGMLGDPAAGWIIALCHWLSVFCCFLLFTRRSPRIEATGETNTAQSTALSAELLGNSISKASLSMVTVGGFIIFFSLLQGILSAYGLLPMLSKPVEWCFSITGLSPALAEGLMKGLIEVTTGSQAVCSARAPLFEKCGLLCFLLSFGGLSVIAQSLAFLRCLKIKPLSFILGKLLQGILSVLFCVLFFCLRFLLLP